MTAIRLHHKLSLCTDTGKYSHTRPRTNENQSSDFSSYKHGYCSSQSSPTVDDKVADNLTRNSESPLADKKYFHINMLPHVLNLLLDKSRQRLKMFLGTKSRQIKII